MKHRLDPTWIPLIDLSAVNGPHGDELEAAFREVLAAGDFGSGDQVAAFEHELAAQVGATHAVGVSSGTSALSLALVAAGLRRGDEVLVPANTFFATASAAVAIGATPVAVEIDPRTALLDLDAAAAAITSRTAALAVVHLYGNPVDMDRARALADRHHLLLVEDAAQALGAAWRGRPVGSLADVSTFSFYPTKNLGALGQGGAVTTGREDVARSIRERRDQGSGVANVHVVWGGNERLHGMQAAFLRVKLRHLPSAQHQRLVAASRYHELLAAAPGVRPFATAAEGVHAHHLFAVAVEERDAVRAWLRHAGIETGVHYPVPVHRQPAWTSTFAVPSLPHAERHAATTMSLPFWPGISGQQIAQVARALAAATTGRPEVRPAPRPVVRREVPSTRSAAP